MTLARKTQVWRIKTSRAYALNTGYGWFQFHDEKHNFNPRRGNRARLSVVYLSKVL